tara:strand:+ start:99 stop:641 length:543 start_codon:yes stop_codon:yes gene_type:complete
MSIKIFNGVQSTGLRTTSSQFIRATAERIKNANLIFVPNSTNILHQCDIVMAAQNISISHESKDFSLLGDPAKDETNMTNFRTSQDLKAEPILIDAMDKFPVGDQVLQDVQSQKVSEFYEQDDEKTSREEEQTKAEAINDSEISYFLSLSMASPKSNTKTTKDMSTNKYLSRTKRKITDG